MVRLLQFALLAAWFVGCSSPRPNTAASSASPSVLEQLLMPESAVVRVREAERDLPTDKWETLPKIGHTNRSRSAREIGLAHELLPTIRPSIAKMSARELLESLKTFPYPEYGSFPGVAYYIYRDGNQMIIKELAGRSAKELSSLRPFRDDRHEVFTGDSGPPLSVGDLVRYDLLHEPLQ
jgi:hypothetical protein